MIPIRDDNPHFMTPYVTVGIIVLNVAAWVLLQGMGQPWPLTESVCKYGLIPGELLRTVPPNTIVDLGGGQCVLTQPHWYTVVTSMFMHGGWFHLIGNMWFLWIFGNNVEDSMGHGRFAVFYLLCGLCAAATQVLIDPASPVPMIGASGAIGGVMGAYVVLYPRVRVHLLIFLGFFITTFSVPAIFMLGYWFLLQFIGGASSLGSGHGGVAFWAHVGGFAAGALLIFLFKKQELVERHPFYGWNPPAPRG